MHHAVPSSGVIGPKYPLRLEDYASAAALVPVSGEKRLPETEAPAGSASGHSSRPHPTAAKTSLIDVRTGPTRAERLRGAFKTAGSGRTLDLNAVEQHNLQSFVLDLAQELFSNEFNTDAALKHQIGLKQPHFDKHRIDAGEAEAVVFGLSKAEQQRRCLAAILVSFRGENDAELRIAAFQKIEQIGDLSSMPLLMDWARRGTASDLYHGLQALLQACKRHGAPPPRRRLEGDSEIGPILTNAHRSEAEATKAILAVLQRGSVEKAELLTDGLHRNEVWFITFEDKLTMADGRQEPIRGVFKPERYWPGKDVAFFPREVASFDFEQQFVGSNLIPPTIEAILSPDGSPELGSLQYLIPRARTLGVSSVEWDPELKNIEHEPNFVKALSQARLLLYVLGDPDKLENNIHPEPNLLNFLVDDTGRLWMIDNAYNLGAAPEPDDGLLPKPGSVPVSAKRVADANHDHVRSVLTLYIGQHEADGVAWRMGIAGSKL